MSLLEKRIVTLPFACLTRLTLIVLIPFDPKVVGGKVSSIFKAYACNRKHVAKALCRDSPPLEAEIWWIPLNALSVSSKAGRGLSV